VFCSSCGTKLDLSDMSSERFVKRGRVFMLLRQWRLVAIAFVVWCLGCAGLALWPRTGKLGEPGTLVGAGRAERQFLTLLELPKDRSLSVVFAEKDLNGFLEFIGLKRNPEDLCSLEARPGEIHARVARRVGPVGLGPVMVSPSVTVDIFCVPSGGRLAVRRISMGHLPLAGPARSRAIQYLASLFSRWPERSIMDSLKAIKIEEDRVEISVQK
jgi:hypothetical protein